MNTPAKSTYTSIFQNVYGPATMLRCIGFPRSRRRIFDFGGNVGNLSYSYSTYLEGMRSLNWTVFDPSVVKEGEKIEKKTRCTGTKIHDKGGVQKVTTSCLCPARFTTGKVASRHLSSNFVSSPENLIVNRTPVHNEQPSFVTVQRTAECAVPCIVRNAAGMIEDFVACGYTLVDRWPAIERSLRIPLFPERTVEHYFGVLLPRRLPTPSLRTPTDPC
jgi:putative methyltransferase (TIGR04325 family)